MSPDFDDAVMHVGMLDGRGGGSPSKSSVEAEVGNTEEEPMMALTAGGGFMGNTAAVFGVQDIEEAVATWRADEWTEMMFKSLRKVQSNEELWKLIDPLPTAAKIKFKWAETWSRNPPFHLSRPGTRRVWMAAWACLPTHTFRPCLWWQC